MTSWIGWCGRWCALGSKLVSTFWSKMGTIPSSSWLWFIQLEWPFTKIRSQKWNEFLGVRVIKKSGTSSMYRSKSWEGLGETPYSSSAGIHAASGILSEIFDTLASLNIHVDEVKIISYLRLFPRFFSSFLIFLASSYGFSWSKSLITVNVHHKVPWCPLKVMMKVNH